MNGEADCPTDLEMAAPKGQDRWSQEDMLKLTFSNFIYKPKEKISRSPADNQSCKMSVLPGIIAFGGVIIMCLVCLLASRKNNTCSFSYQETNNVYVHRPQLIVENRVFSRGQGLPLAGSREIQPYKKEN